MKIKNTKNNPIWIRNIKLMPGEVKEVPKEYKDDVKSLRLPIIDEKEEKSEIEKLIPLKGVEDELARELIDRFDSLDGVRKASLEELEGIPGIGKKRAKMIKEQLEE